MLETQTITPTITPFLSDYKRAVSLRIVAEKYTDPELYEEAAAAFAGIDMPLSAQCMRDRAAHYRSNE